MSEYHDKRAKEIIESIKYATIATVNSEGNPWNSPVAHTIDDQLNIYWASDKDNEHSRNIRNNENVAIVIYDSTARAGEGEGVYIVAKAFELDDPEEILAVRRLKKGNTYQPQPGEFQDDAIRRIYKAIPVRGWMNDAEEKNGEFIRDYRVELQLDVLK